MQSIWLFRRKTGLHTYFNTALGSLVLASTLWVWVTTLCCNVDRIKRRIEKICIRAKTHENETKPEWIYVYHRVGVRKMFSHLCRSDFSEYVAFQKTRIFVSKGQRSQKSLLYFVLQQSSNVCFGKYERTWYNKRKKKSDTNNFRKTIFIPDICTVKSQFLTSLV